MTPTIDRRQLEDLKSRVDLAELFQHFGLEPKRRGKNWSCQCPFHDGDTEASLSINNERRLWQCFSCKAAGDAFDFLRLKEKLEFPAALAVLQERAGALPPPAPTGTGILPGNFKRPELLGRVAEIYHKRFCETGDGQSYLKQRGLSSLELWKAFQIGFCDGSLLKTLPSEGPIVEALQALGVLTADRKEHFRGCVVVPLTHPDFGVVGLYGRRIRPDAKSRHLYLPGPHQGVLNWQALKVSATVVVTESVLDALAAWQAGCREVSCVYGTQAVPEAFLELLKRFGVQDVVFALDGDRAGLEALPRLSAQLPFVRLASVRLPDEKDPCQLLEEQGETALLRCLQKRQVEASALPPTQKAPLEKGFEMTAGDVTYRIEMIPPFSSRLRANVGAYHTSGRWTRDRLDFYLQRDRDKLVRQLGTQLQLARPTAENHVSQLLQEAEDWVQSHRKPDPAEASEKKPELTAQQREEALHFLRHPQLAEQILKDMENLGYIGEENPKLLAYLIGVSRKLPKGRNPKKVQTRRMYLP